MSEPTGRHRSAETNGTAELVEAGPTRCPVSIGPGCLNLLGERLNGRRAQLIADEYVLDLHGRRLPAELARSALHIPRGEQAKSWAVLGDLLERLAASGLDRDCVLVTFGGGATCDVGGLAAALHLRGMDVIHLPTTLLAQVDASVGGKTAINLRAGKNLAGRIHAPSAVLCDTHWLSTLSPEEWRSGLGEVLKSAILSGEADLHALEKAADDLAAHEPQASAATVARCVRHKARVVTADEQERGERELLNLGHTYGHAIEQLFGYGEIPHGVAVAAGIGAALEASEHFGVLTDSGLRDRVAQLAGRLGLPGSIADLQSLNNAPGLSGQALVEAMGTDKKARAGVLRFIGIESPGSGRFGLAWDPATVAELLDRSLGKQLPSNR